jgi:phosphoribosylformimino-5-aminoimidazole carboxamide ribonucleotide (ProFAR) isomerase
LPTYEAQVLPGIAERLRARDLEGAAEQARRVEEAIERMSRRLEAIR